MGVLVGTPVQLVRFAPLGDPVEIKVRGYHLTLRRQDAEQILVQAAS
jgi:ferrous iron transport protein A